MSLIENMWPNGVPSFGAEMRKEFLLGCIEGSENVAYCNHGSYGATPKKVMDERVKLLMEVENYPDLWYRKTEEEKYNLALERAGQFLGANPDDLAFVGNTTTGVNTILRAFQFDPEDVLLCTSHIYSAVLNAADSVVTKANADLLSIDIPGTIKTEDEIINLFEQTLLMKKSIKLAIIDHISSASAILYPIKRLAKILHSHGILVLGDGAHAPGQADFRIDDLGVDFYTASLHKWCYAPKGTGLLWVHPKHQDLIRPLVVSHNYKKSFKKEFLVQGTSDLTRYNALPKALYFYASVGGREAITEYVTELLDWAVQLISEALGTQPQQIPDSMRAPYMRVIEFPDLSSYDGVPPSHPHANDLTLELVSEYEVVSCLMHFNGKYWIRLSANIYNCKEDYIRLKDGILKFLKKKTGISASPSSVPAAVTNGDI